MDRFISLVIVLFLVNIATAQIRVTGVVTSSEDATTIPYATILVKGLQNVGTATDENGRFILPNVSPDATLVFSYIGFITQEVIINGQEVINVVLEPQLLTRRFLTAIV